MKKFTAEMARKMALDRVLSLGDVRIFDDDPLQTLRTFHWDFGGEREISQQEMTRLNLVLDQQSCLGRVALAMALVERNYPGVEVGYAEVLKDQLRRDMLARVYTSLPEHDPILRDEWLCEVLMYEEPHAVPLVNGVQFDPLSTVYPEEIYHPVVQAHPAWSGVASAMMVSLALSEDRPEAKLQILEEAERVCPGTTVVSENKVGALILLHRDAEAVGLLENLLKRRPCARTLYVLWLLTREWGYLDQLNQEYTKHMINILQRGGEGDE
jgi:hypothetical protein